MTTVDRPTIRTVNDVWCWINNGPQPVCNGIQSDRPGFIFRSQQKSKSLVLNIGVLPSRRVRITPTGRVKELSTHE